MDLLSHQKMIFQTNVFLKIVQEDRFKKIGTGKNCQVEKPQGGNGYLIPKYKTIFFVIIVHFLAELVKLVGLKKVIATFKMLI